MWRPLERIRHDSTPAAWPTAEAAAKSRLYSPIRVGPVVLAHRTWVPAMVPWRATENGDVTPEVLAWYQRFARGRPAAMVVEATGIRDVPSGPLLRIGHDRFIPGLTELVRVVREASGGHTRLFIQVIDFLAIRRRPEPTKFFERYLAITSAHRAAFGRPEAPEAQVRHWLASLDADALSGVLSAREMQALQEGYRERVTDTDLAHIRELPLVLPTLFAQAAERARRAGFDGVELHYAHAYTMASFLSRLNDRRDGYGGDLAGRVRLPREVCLRVRAAVGQDFVVGCRMLTEDCIDGGGTIADSAFFACELASAGLDYISLSRGGKFEDASQPKVGEAAYPYTGQSGYECMPSYYSDARGPFGRNLASAAQVRERLRAQGLNTPVVVAGGIHNFAQAETALAQGQADIVGFARQSLADPDWFQKVRLGRGNEVRLCTYTNYCEALDQRHRQVTCSRWDRQDLDEPGVARSADGKRRLTAPRWDA
jgi:2,4-dienoyl-CoA reductase-like NADH-dependent reductase (Old Yellow Enzyme family)